jgi:splicing factor 3B subunit 4
MPKDKVTGRHQGYGFVEFRSEEDADYAIKVMNMVKLFGKPIRANKSSQNKQSLDVGAWRCAAPLRCSCWCGASL